MSGQETTIICSVCGAPNPEANRFCGTCGSRLEGGHAVARMPEERRWATVLFVDISGFTSMSERIDPEDVRELAQQCLRTFSEQITRFGGTVLREMGDEVLAVFGAPTAHEDDPERAVRAGIAIRDAPMYAPDGTRLRVHVGINTGEIITTLVSLGTHEDYTVHGDAVNTAARLRGAATPGTVLVGEETHRATEHVVTYQDREPIIAKGKDQPVLAWEALEVASLPIARPSRSGPLVGRQEELQLLSGIWAKVSRESRPHLVTVLGDPGIGKTRLASEFERSIGPEATVLHGRCPPYGEVAGYFALTLVLREAAGIAAEDAPVVARAKLQALVQRVVDPEGTAGTSAEIFPHVARLAGVDGSDGAMGVSDQPSVYVGFRRFLESFARAEPLVLVIDDLHWADDALLDIIEFAASRVRDVPLLILTQARPDLLDRRPTWGRGVRAFSSVSLEPLDSEAAGRLITALSAQFGLAASVTDHVSQGAGGNPLFAEELVAMLAERGGTTRIPSAIKALISARVDALSPDERTVLQRAAVFGKVFWQEGVRALSVPEPLEDHLESLEYRDLLRAQPRSRFPGDREYAFKHDLIRDVAFEMLLRAERRSLHGRIVDWIEQVSADRAEEYIDLLAYHAVQAGQRARAIHYLVKAGERARQTAAHRSEAGLLTQALEIASEGTDADLATELLVRRGRALGRAALWAEARPDLERALQQMPEDRIEQRAEALVDLAAVVTWGYGAREARRIAEEALALIESVDRPDLIVGATTYLATDEVAQGDTIAGLHLFSRVDEQVHQSKLSVTGSTLQGLTMSSIAFYWAGNNDEAVRAGTMLVDEARDRSESVSLMLALPHLGLALAAKGNYREAFSTFEEARKFGREYEIWGPLARSISMSAGFHLELFDYAGHVELTHEARELGEARFPPTLAFTGVDLILNAARRGEPGEVEGLIASVSEEVSKATAWHRWLTKIRLFEARAELALALGDPDAALEWANNAIARSRESHRKKYEALGLHTRAAALHRRGSTREATADLRSAIHLVREMDDTALFVRVAASLLELDGDDDLAAEAGRHVERILAGLPDRRMREGFQAAEAVRGILQYARVAQRDDWAKRGLTE